MKATYLAISDLILLEPKMFGDDLGFFFESYNREAFRQAPASIWISCRAIIHAR